MGKPTTTFQAAGPGVWSTNSYLSSGIPYVTGSMLLTSSFSTSSVTPNSQVRISFPYVTRAITVISRQAADIRIHFNSLADGQVENGHHYMTLSEIRDSITLSVKTRELYISLAAASGGNGEFELFAELTNIPSKEMFPLTGSGLTD